MQHDDITQFESDDDAKSRSTRHGKRRQQTELAAPAAKRP
jgi:hypothetical protein